MKDCIWTQDEDGLWHTACGEMSVINEGTPYDNKMAFCWYCGGRLEYIKHRSN